jgi:hypothetical protein
MEKSQFGNPSIFCLGIFGFSLAMIGVELAISHEAGGAAMFSVLAAGILEVICGVWLIAKGESYIASIVALFGGWLLGFFFYNTWGRALGMANPIGNAWYMFALLPPIVLLAVPAFKLRKLKLVGAFVSLFALALILGIGFLLGPRGAGAPWMTVAGICSFIAAFFIWWLMNDNINELFHPHKEEEIALKHAS